MSRKSLPVYATELSDDLTYPSRSPLYALAPIGVGTPAVESLTSYLTRLAHAHGVVVDQLAVSQLAPLVNKSDVSTQAKFAHRPYNLNGINHWTAMMLTALEELTLRNDLCFLTMYPWRNVLSSFKLLRHHQAWCPACYHDWQQTGQTPYIPLLWTLEAVQVCPYHRQALSQQCPHADCRQWLPLINSQVKMGYCPACHRWLGNGSTRASGSDWPELELPWQHWVTAQLGELLAAAPRLPTAPPPPTLAHNLHLCLRDSGHKYLREAARSTGMGSHLLSDWLQGPHLPQLSLLLRLCFQQSWPLLELFTPRSDSGGSHEGSPATAAKRVDVTRLRRQLEAILADNQRPPDTVVRVARQFGVHRSTIEYHCPELYRQLVERHAQSQLSQVQVRNEVLERNLKASLESTEVPPPPVFEIARRLRFNPRTLRRNFPDLCRLLSGKRKVYSQARRLRAEAELKAALATEAASQPSIRVIAARLDEDRTYLYQVFPELCRAVTDRKVKALSAPALSAPSGQRSLSCSRTPFSAPGQPPPLRKPLTVSVGTKVLPPPPGSKEAPECDDPQAQKAGLANKLRGILAANAAPAPSLNQVAQRLGIAVTTLKQKCPELCADIVRRRQDHRTAIKHRQQALLEQLVGENPVPPPSLMEVARRLGGSDRTSLQYQCPEASQTIVTRYQAYQEQMRQAAYAALEAAINSRSSLPPLPIQVARQLGHPTSRYLRDNFPELCHHLVQARAAYLQHARQAKLEALLAEKLVDLPMSLHCAGQQLKCDSSVMKQSCPELCQEIADRRLSYIEEKKRAVKHALEMTLSGEQTPPRPLDAIAREFGRNPATLRHWFPELVAGVIEKYRIYRHDTSRVRRRHDEHGQVKQLSHRRNQPDLD